MVKVFFKLDTALCHAVGPVAGKCVHHLGYSNGAINSNTFVQHLQNTGYTSECVSDFFCFTHSKLKSIKFVPFTECTVCMYELHRTKHITHVHAVQQTFSLFLSPNKLTVWKMSASYWQLYQPHVVGFVNMCSLSAGINNETFVDFSGGSEYFLQCTNNHD